MARMILSSIVGVLVGLVPHLFSTRHGHPILGMAWGGMFAFTVTWFTTDFKNIGRDYDRKDIASATEDTSIAVMRMTAIVLIALCAIASLAFLGIPTCQALWGSFFMTTLGGHAVDPIATLLPLILIALFTILMVVTAVMGVGERLLNAITAATTTMIAGFAFDASGVWPAIAFALVASACVSALLKRTLDSIEPEFNP